MEPIEICSEIIRQKTSTKNINTEIQEKLMEFIDFQKAVNDISDKIIYIRRLL